MSKQNNSTFHPSVSPPLQSPSDSQPLTYIYRAPSESQIKWREASIYREFAGVAQIGGKTNGVESGRFWSILAKSFPIVSPTNLRWGNANKENHDYNSNRI